MTTPTAATAQDVAREVTRAAISAGERPAFRVWPSGQGGWLVEQLPWLTGQATDAQEIPAAARHALAAWLDVDGAAFDVDVASRPIRSMTPPKDEGQLYGG